MTAGGVVAGEWNHAIGVLGGVGAGKSTYALGRARELGASPAYVLAHDPTRSYRGPDVARHQTAGELCRALATSPGGVHCVDVADPSVVVALALDVALAAKRAGGGGRAVPVLVVLDEAVAFSGMSPSYVEPRLREAFLLRRHRNVGFLWTTQRPQNVHPLFYESATELVLLGGLTDRAWGRVEECGVPSTWKRERRGMERYTPQVFRVGVDEDHQNESPRELAAPSEKLALARR